MQSDESTSVNSAQQTSLESSTQQVTYATLNMVIQTIDGTAELHRVPIEIPTMGCRVFDSLRAEFKKSMSWMLRFFYILGVVSVKAYIAEYTLVGLITQPTYLALYSSRCSIRMTIFPNLKPSQAMSSFRTIASIAHLPEHSRMPSH